jgi:hypothetical protein
MYQLYKVFFHCWRNVCPNRTPKHKHKIPSTELPWFWIGAEFADRTETVTDIVNNVVQYGNVVDSVFLEEVTGCKHVVSWKYVDVKTLKEREIPSKGIVIEHGV